MKAFIIFLSLVSVVGCVTGGFTNRAVANAVWRKTTFDPRCELTEKPRRCLDIYLNLKRATSRSLAERRYALSCISERCPAGHTFESCVWDCVDEAKDECDSWFPCMF